MGLLRKEYPEIYDQLHPTQNHGVALDELRSKSHKDLWWICTADPNFSHFFKQKVANMTKHKSFRCKVCCSIGGRRPDLIAHWDYEKYVRKPSYLGAPIKTLFDKVKKKEAFFWKCPRGHIEKEPLSVAAKTQRKNICKQCNSILYTHPTIAESYATKNTIDILDISAGQKCEVFWRCSKGHEDLISVNERVREGVGCRICSGKKIISGINSLADLNPKIVAEWDWKKNNEIGIFPNEIGPGFSGQKVFWKCEKHGSYAATVANRNHNSNPTGCGKCKPQTSRNELRIFFELKHVFKNAQHRKKIDNSEVDIYLPELKLGVQFDGWYWHKDSLKKDKLQHKLLHSAGINLIRVRETPLAATHQTDLFIRKNAIITFEDICRILHLIIRYNNEQLHHPLRHKIYHYIHNGDFSATQEYSKTLTENFKIPKGASLEEMYPSIALEWDYERNFPVTPSMITPGVAGDVNGDYYFWNCSQNKDHASYQMPVYARTGRQKQGCPQCAGRIPTHDNNLQLKFPKLAEMFDRAENELNGKPVHSSEIMPKSGQRFTWVCDEDHLIRDKTPDEMSRAKYLNGCVKCYKAAIKTGMLKVGNHKHDHSEILKLYKRHQNLSKVAQIVGCSPSTVSNVLIKNGLRP